MKQCIKPIIFYSIKKELLDFSTKGDTLLKGLAAYTLKKKKLKLFYKNNSAISSFNSNFQKRWFQGR